MIKFLVLKNITGLDTLKKRDLVSMPWNIQTLFQAFNWSYINFSSEKKNKGRNVSTDQTFGAPKTFYNFRTSIDAHIA